MALSLRALSVANLDATGAELAGFDANDTGALVRSGSFHNGDDTEYLLVSLDAGVTFPIRVAPGGYYPLPSGEPYRLGGSAGGLFWKASANTITLAALLYLAHVAAAAVAD